MYITLPRWAKDKKETRVESLKARMKRGNITIDPWEGREVGSLGVEGQLQWTCACDPQRSFTTHCASV